MRFAGARPLIVVLMSSFLLAFEPASPPPRVSVDVKDAQVQDVLRLFAEVGKHSLVVSERVRGRVTVRLRDVIWTDAIDVVLRSRGLGRVTEGKVIFVDTLEALAEADRGQLERLTAQREAAPLVTRLIPVRYARAEDLAPIVRSVLSPRGSVTVDRRTNVLIVTDVQGAVARAASVVGRRVDGAAGPG